MAVYNAYFSDPSHQVLEVLVKDKDGAKNRSVEAGDEVRVDIDPLINIKVVSQVKNKCAHRAGKIEYGSRLLIIVATHNKTLCPPCCTLHAMCTKHSVQRDEILDWFRHVWL